MLPSHMTILCRIWQLWSRVCLHSLVGSTLEAQNKLSDPRSKNLICVTPCRPKPGLRFLKPKPGQAGPKPVASGQAKASGFRPSQSRHITTHDPWVHHSWVYELWVYPGNSLPIVWVL